MPGPLRHALCALLVLPLPLAAAQESAPAEALLRRLRVDTALTGETSPVPLSPRTGVDDARAEARRAARAWSRVWREEQARWLEAARRRGRGA